MKKSIILLSCMAISANAFAQNGNVGVNTSTPAATLDIQKSPIISATTPVGLLLPRLTQTERNAMQKEAMLRGLQIFNTSKNCIDWWNGSTWQCTNGNIKDKHGDEYIVPDPPTITSEGDFEIRNTAYWYSSIYDADYLDSNGKLASASGKAHTKQVTADGITGPNEPILDVQGKISATEPIEIYIPIKRIGNNDITLGAWSQEIEIPAEYTQDNNKGVAVLSWEQATVNNNTTFILAKIKAKGTDINLKKLDLVGGQGLDQLGILIGSFTLPKNKEERNNHPNTWTGKVDLRLISGIPDRCFAKTTQQCVGYGAEEKEHEFIYIPIQGPDGKTWLSNNLGAEYARVGSPWFNPTRQAGALDPAVTNSARPLTNPTADQIKKDWRAYGSLFQWQRQPDGHELINWTNQTNGTPKYAGTGSISNSWTNAGSNKFIADDKRKYIWVHDVEGGDYTHLKLWVTAGITNPCPSGFRVSDYNELYAVYSALEDSYFVSVAGSYERALRKFPIRVPAAGYRGWDGDQAIRYVGELAGLWGTASTSALTGSNLAWYGFPGVMTALEDTFPALGMSVRCIKD